LKTEFSFGFADPMECGLHTDRVWRFKATTIHANHGNVAGR
jgi:hypothetical protein